MADTEGPVCTNCKVTSSLMWQRSKNGAILCLECHNAEKTTKSSASSETSSHSSSYTERVPHSNSPPRIASPNVTTRRATRSRERNTRAKQNQSGNTNTKGNEKQSSKSVENHIKGNTPQETVHTPSSTSTKDRNYPYQQQRGRRSILKQQQQPMKSPVPQPVVVTSDSVTHKVSTYTSVHFFVVYIRLFTLAIGQWPMIMIGDSCFNV